MTNASEHKFTSNGNGSAAPPVIETRKLEKVYTSGEVEVRALRGIDLKIGHGEFVAIMGASGSGKSTLMNILGCLDLPTSGEFLLDGVAVNKLNRNQLADIRNEKIGFVFQGFNLLARTSAIENVELPLLYNRAHPVSNSKDIARRALERVGLGDRLDYLPSQLSGGQQQRVAIARALVNSPSLILADEPTGNLDSRTSIEVISLFRELNDTGITVIIVTHEPELADFTKRIIDVRDGLIKRDGVVAQRTDPAEALRLVDEELARET